MPIRQNETQRRAALVSKIEGLPHRSIPWRRIVLYMTLIICSCMFVVPFLWMLSTSVKPITEAFRVPPALLPTHWEWGNYVTAVTKIPYFNYMFNTMLITVLTVVGTLFSSSMVAYSLGKINWVGRKIIMPLLLATMFIPGQVTLIPTYKIWYGLHMTGTFWPLIIPSFLGSAFYIFMLRQFVTTIPDSLLDSARIDGANELRIYWQIVLPLMRPALMAVGILTFLGAWSDFFGPLIYLSEQKKWTLSLGLQQFVNQHDTLWGPLMAAASIFTVPIIILFFVGQRYIIESVTLTGYK